MSDSQQKPTLTLFAGSTAGSGNIDGMGNVARFTLPNAITVDPSGNFYVIGNVNHNTSDNSNTIRKMTPLGEVTTLAGTAGVSGSHDGQSTTASFNQPSGVASDTLGNIFVADSGNHIIRKITPTGLVSTFAGMAEHSGSDDGIGSLARFNWPRGIAIDSKNNIYVAEWNAHTVRKITASGEVSTFAGQAGVSGLKEGKGTAARLKFPTALVLDRADNLYVAGYDTISKITPNGMVTVLNHFVTLNSENEKVPARLDGIKGIAIDSNNNLFITEQSTVIRKISPQGMVSTLAGSDLGLAKSIGSNDGKGSHAMFNRPAGLVVDNKNNIWVCDEDNHTIRKITPAGHVTTIAGEAITGYGVDGIGAAARFSKPDNIAADNHGNIYLSDRNSIRKITPNAVVTTLAKRNWNAIYKTDQQPPDYVISFQSTINGLVTDEKGSVYISSSFFRQVGSHYASMLPPFLREAKFDKVSAVSPSATVRTVAGKSAGLTLPAGMVIDKKGHIYAAISEDNTIVKITPRKIFSSRVNIIAGTLGIEGSEDGLNNKAQFNYPTDVAIDSKQNLYVTDYENHTIRKITPIGMVSTFAGKAGEPGSADGSGKQSRFNGPKSITIDSHDNLYVVDSNNQTVRRITPQAIVSTFVGQVGRVGFISGDLPGVIPHPKSVVVHKTSLYISVSKGVVVVRNLPK